MSIEISLGNSVVCLCAICSYKVFETLSTLQDKATQGMLLSLRVLVCVCLVHCVEAISRSSAGEDTSPGREDDSWYLAALISCLKTPRWSSGYSG